MARKLGGIDVVGVTKCVCGAPGVARAMLAGGVVALAESRHENAQRLREAGITAPLWLLRMPSPALAADTVRLFDVSLATQLETCAALDAAARDQGVRHKVIVMVELGDLREGIMPSELPAFVEAVERLEHLELAGIGTNLTCYGAIVPDEHNMSSLIEMARAAERQAGRALLVSAAIPAPCPWCWTAACPPASAAAHRRDHPARHRHPDAPAAAGPARRRVVLEVPLVETRVKPSAPYGCAAQSAWATSPCSRTAACGAAPSAPWAARTAASRASRRSTGVTASGAPATTSCST